MKSILQDWVMQLGLRHQGVLLAPVRGCDNMPRLDPSKSVTRCYRAAILNAHCGDPAKAATYIEVVSIDDLHRRMEDLRKNCDHYPLHYLTHLMHAAQVVGCKGPQCLPDGRYNAIVHAVCWGWFYAKLCRSLHVNIETEEEMDRRLDADEETFARHDRVGGRETP